MPAGGYEELRGRQANPLDSSGALLVNFSALPGFQALVGTALERAEAGLSNAISTSARKQGSGEWLACGSPLESVGFNCRPLGKYLDYCNRPFVSSEENVK